MLHVFCTINSSLKASGSLLMESQIDGESRVSQILPQIRRNQGAVLLGRICQHAGTGAATIALTIHTNRGGARRSARQTGRELIMLPDGGQTGTRPRRGAHGALHYSNAVCLHLFDFVMMYTTAQWYRSPPPPSSSPPDSLRPTHPTRS